MKKLKSEKDALGQALFVARKGEDIFEILEKKDDGFVYVMKTSEYFSEY